MLPSLIFTARKRSLGQGNIFTPVCHSLHRGVPAPRGVPGLGGCLLPGSACSSGGLLPGGPAHGGACSRGVPDGGPPRQLLLQVVCILLECILVFDCRYNLRHTSKFQDFIKLLDEEFYYH